MNIESTDDNHPPNESLVALTDWRYQVPRFARYILMCACLAGLVTVSGCGKSIFNPDPAQEWYDGAVFNTTDENRRVHIADPDPEHAQGSDDDYTQPRRIDALNGVQSYWLREREYTFVITHAVTGREVARVRRKPNGLHNDRSRDRIYTSLDWYLENTTWYN